MIQVLKPEHLIQKNIYSNESKSITKETIGRLQNCAQKGPLVYNQ